MGRASRQKRERRAEKWARIMDRVRLVMEADQADMCATCAFRDPEAFICDPLIAEKLLKSFQTHQPFFCHKDMETDVEGAYLPPKRPDGRPDVARMHMCAGYLAFVRRFQDAPEAFAEAVAELRKRLLARFLSDEESALAGRFRELTDGRVDVELLDNALTMFAETKRGRELMR